MYILNNQQTKILEDSTAASGIPHILLMEFAGTAVAKYIYGNRPVEGKRIAVVCGCGNNGGDGFVAARKLVASGADVTILFASGDPTTADAAEMLQRIKDETDVPCVYYNKSPEEFSSIIKYADIIVDAIFGIGFHGVARSPIDSIFSMINDSQAVVYSVDVPSGVDSDNGQVEGICVNADYTITFTSLKPAHVIYPAVDYCGEIFTASIGIPDDILHSLDTNIRAIDFDLVKSLFKKRRRNTNKGDFGKLLSICGSFGMAGSAVLAASAAVSSGTGLVKMAMPRSIYTAVASQIIEPVMLILDENGQGSLSASCCNRILHELDGCTSCLIGCGLGLNDDTTEVVSQVITNSNVPLVIDADGINAVSKNLSVLRNTKAPIVMTPHPGEMGRLVGKTALEVQEQRMSIASSFSMTYGVHLILKGANTIIADPDGNIYVNLTGNPGMSKAGSGDVLAGLVASFVAQGLSPLNASIAAVYIHGAAGDEAAAKYSQHCMTPHDIISEMVPLFLKIEQ